jgi:nicotinate-nucleotide adenylyltransferase
VHLVDAPQMEISSTMIRDSIRAGKPARYMLPEKVFQYLDEEGFYK